MIIIGTDPFPGGGPGKGAFPPLVVRSGVHATHDQVEETSGGADIRVLAGRRGTHRAGIISEHHVQEAMISSRIRRSTGGDHSFAEPGCEGVTRSGIQTPDKHLRRDRRD
ncbi:MAG: hypothetical protein EOP84_24980 [Verrucomicrobiaceae bacterium]|nr:MAG: hypothetical protein EOP84_24980 [Verrucomicrobiaceae bacterium]